MSIISPLTAGSEIVRAKPQISAPLITENNNIKGSSVFGEFANDIVKISSLGQEKQQTERQLNDSNVDNIANEVIRINTSIGKSKSLGNLTNSQATELYRSISQLL